MTTSAHTHIFIYLFLYFFIYLYMHIRLQNNLRVEATPMQTLVFHPQSHWLAVSFLSGAVRIFDVETQVADRWVMAGWYSDSVL